MAETRRKELAPDGWGGDPGRSRNILVVDDEDSVRELVGTFLRHYGYTVFMAANANEGLSLFRKHAVDLLITDVVMPDMSGTQLAARLWRAWPHLPVLFMSGAADGRAQFERGRFAYPSAYLAKPFSFKLLLDTVAELMENNSCAAPFAIVAG